MSCNQRMSYGNCYICVWFGFYAAFNNLGNIATDRKDDIGPTYYIYIDIKNMQCMKPKPHHPTYWSSKPLILIAKTYIAGSNGSDKGQTLIQRPPATGAYILGTEAIQNLWGFR